MTQAEQFSENLVYLQDKAGLSCNDLAKRVGVNVNSIYNLRRGRYLPTVENLIKLARALDCSPALLLAGL